MNYSDHKEYICDDCEIIFCVDIIEGSGNITYCPLCAKNVYSDEDEHSDDNC